MQLKKEKSYEKQDGKKEGHTREIHRFAASQAARGGVAPRQSMVSDCFWLEAVQIQTDYEKFS